MSGDSEGQGRLTCCSPWGCKVGHNLATEQQQRLVRLNIFSYTCSPLVYLLWKYSYPTWSFDYFLNRIVFFLFFFFLLLNCTSSLYILSINPLSDIVCIYFLPYNRLSYNFVDYFFCCEEALRLEVVPFVHFWFWCLCFRCHIQKSLSRSMSRSYYPFVSF